MFGPGMFGYKCYMLSVSGETLIASGLIFFCVLHMQDEANSYYEILCFLFFILMKCFKKIRAGLTTFPK